MKLTIFLSIFFLIYSSPSFAGSSASPSPSPTPTCLSSFKGPSSGKSFPEGTQLYDPTTHSLQFCNGTQFTPVSGSPISSVQIMRSAISGSAVNTSGPPVYCPKNYVLMSCQLMTQSKDGQSLFFQQKIQYVDGNGRNTLSNPQGCFSTLTDTDDKTVTVATCISTQSPPPPSSIIYTSAQGGGASPCWNGSSCGSGYGTPPSCPAGYVDQGVQTDCGNPLNPQASLTLQLFYQLNDWGCPSAYPNEGVSIRTCFNPKYAVPGAGGTP